MRSILGGFTVLVPSLDLVTPILIQLGLSPDEARDRIEGATRTRPIDDVPFGDDPFGFDEWVDEW